MADFIGYILEIYLDIKHWFKVKKRRKFEKENNLPKKVMISPLNKIWIVILIISIPIFIFRVYNLTRQGNKITTTKIKNIIQILEEEKKQFGLYPYQLKDIIRNNPLRKGINQDYWNNEFLYTLSKDSLNYSIISLGGDQKRNTADDLIFTNKQ